MYGEHVNALKMYTRSVYYGPSTLIWERNKELGDEWLRAEVPLMSDKNFQVVIEGLRGVGYLGDIGIDDISFTPECKVNSVDELPSYLFPTATADPTCSAPEQFRCEVSKKCISLKDVCNFRYDCGGNDQSDEALCPWACNFDSKLNSNFYYFIFSF